MTAASDGASIEPRGASTTGAGMPSVLVIDDEKGFAHMLRTMLSERGFDAAEAYDGTTAVEILRERGLDAVLCDVVMPGLAGTALLEAVRGLPRNAGIPVVFMSALPEKRVRQIVAGDYAFLGKPFMIERAVAAVRAAVHRPPLRIAGNGG